ncbi:Hexosyltransferase [Sergentomyia squamirostris]
MIKLKLFLRLNRQSTRKWCILILLTLSVYALFVRNFIRPPAIVVTTVNEELNTPAPDRRFLINLIDFDYTINLKSCKELGIKPQFIILIHSAPMKRMNRDNIRQTWGGWKVDHRVIFLLGAVSDENLQKQLEIENAVFEDMVQGNFVDSYKNLSYKHIMAMKWATEFCPETQFVFKSDDDIFVNPPFIRKFSHRISNFKNFMMCPLAWYADAIREKTSKWYVSRDEYPNDQYPVYCSGCGVLLSIDTAQKLHKAAERTPFLWVDDVYVLGLVRMTAGLRITPVESLLLESIPADEIFAGKRNITRALDTMFSYELTNVQIRTIWEVVKDYTDRGYYDL